MLGYSKMCWAAIAAGENIKGRLRCVASTKGSKMLRELRKYDNETGQTKRERESVSWQTQPGTDEEIRAGHKGDTGGRKTGGVK